MMMNCRLARSCAMAMLFVTILLVYTTRHQTWPHNSPRIRSFLKEQSSTLHSTSFTSERPNTEYLSPPTTRKLKWNSKRIDIPTAEPVWSHSLENGKKLMQLMSEPEEHIVGEYKTRWHKYEDIERSGWKLSKDKKAMKINDDEKARLLPVIEALNLPPINDWNSPWVKVIWEFPSLKNRYYSNILNPKAGIIVATNNEGFPEKGKDIPEGAPELKHWSDIVGLSWQRECEKVGASSRKLRYVLRVNIINAKTQQTLEQSLGESLDKTLPPTYPGTGTSPLNDGEGKAWLGAPAGSGVAWLLIQHKSLFGSRRTITGINVWNSNNGQPEGFKHFDSIPCMLFTLSEDTE